MEKVMGTEASGHGMRTSAAAGALAGAGGDVAAGTTGCCRVAVPRHESGRTASPAPLAADMRTGSLAEGRLSARNGYGAAQHVRRKKEDG